MSLQVEMYRRGLPVVLGQPFWTTREKLPGRLVHNSRLCGNCSFCYAWRSTRLYLGTMLWCRAACLQRGSTAVESNLLEWFALVSNLHSRYLMIGLLLASLTKCSAPTYWLTFQNLKTKFYIVNLIRAALILILLLICLYVCMYVHECPLRHLDTTPTRSFALLGCLHDFKKYQCCKIFWVCSV